MALTVTITRGENFIVRRDLFLADGVTPLLLANLTILKVTIVQADKVLRTYNYPEPELRQGLSTSQAELEVSTTTSDLIIPGKAKLIWYLRRTNPTFVFEGNQLDVIVEDNIIVISQT